MIRTSGNVITGGRLVDGYDYTNQAWVKNGVYVDCGHPSDFLFAEEEKCGCFGRKNKGVQTGAGFTGEVFA